jgi:hypothetical protein
MPATAAPRSAGSVLDKPKPESRAAEVLPSRAFVRVVLRYASSASDAETRAESLARSLRAAGYAVDAVADHAGLAGGPGGAQYFYAEDQDSAAAVLKAAGMSGQATISSAATPRPPGMIELVLPAEAPAEAPAGAIKAASRP